MDVKGSSSSNLNELSLLHDIISTLKESGKAIPTNKQLFQEFLYKHHYVKKNSDNLVEKVYKVLYNSMSQLTGDIPLVEISDDSGDEFQLSYSNNVPKRQRKPSEAPKEIPNTRIEPNVIDLCDDVGSRKNKSGSSKKYKIPCGTSLKVIKKKVKKAWKSIPIDANDRNVNFISKTAELFEEMRKRKKKKKKVKENTLKNGKANNKVVTESYVISHTIEVQNNNETSKKKVNILRRDKVKKADRETSLKSPLPQSSDVTVIIDTLDNKSEAAESIQHRSPLPQTSHFKVDSVDNRRISADSSPITIESVFSLNQDIKPEKDFKHECKHDVEIPKKTFQDVAIQCKPRDFRVANMSYIGRQKRPQKRNIKPVNQLDYLRHDLFIDKLIETTLPIVIQKEEESKKAKTSATC